MSGNLDTLKTEIEDYLAREGFVVFHGCSRGPESSRSVYWDTDLHPDYRAFLGVARGAGIHLVVFHRRELTAEMIDEALDRIEGAGFDREDYRLTVQRLEELRRYEGFTCTIELSFDHESRVYLYERRAAWFDELSNILDEIDYGESDEDEDEEDGPIGSYFSKN